MRWRPHSIWKCQNSGQGVVTEGMYRHVSHKKATHCSHFPILRLFLAVVSPLCVHLPCRVLSSDTSSLISGALSFWKAYWLKTSMTSLSRHRWQNRVLILSGQLATTLLPLCTSCSKTS